MVPFSTIKDIKNKPNRKKVTLPTPMSPRNIHTYLEWNSHQSKLPVRRILPVQSFSSLLRINTQTWLLIVLKTGFLHNLERKWSQDHDREVKKPQLKSSHISQPWATHLLYVSICIRNQLISNVNRTLSSSKTHPVKELALPGKNCQWFADSARRIY